MRSVFYFLAILFLEITCGLVLAFLYSLLSYFLFDKDSFHSKANDLISYMVILLPPFIFCLMGYSRFKRTGQKKNSIIHLTAGLTYLIGGFVLLLFLSDFHLLAN
jgi:hypothetical protein